MPWISGGEKKTVCVILMKTEEALAIARDRGVAMVKRLEALRSVEVNDPEAGQKANSKNFFSDHQQNDVKEKYV